MKKKLFILLATLGLSLSSCSGFEDFFNFNPGSRDTTPNNTTKDLDNSFINTIDNQLRYVSLNKSTLTAIPEETFQFKVAISKQNEEPDYSKEWEGIEWASENNEIASISQDGLLTAHGIGTTRIFARVFTSVGAYCTVNVIAKELESISVKNARKTFIVGSEFSPVFTCVAHYIGGYEEVVTPTSIDYSAVNTSLEGTYTVTMSYTFNDVTKDTSYDVKVIDSPTYEAQDLSYTANDLYRERTYGWYCPNTGTVKSLVIPVYFTDSAKYLDEQSVSKATVVNDLRKAFFGEEGADGWNSVKSYYYKVSGGKLNFTGTVSDWYQTTYPTTYIDSQSKINALVNECVSWYFENHPEEDIHTYDSDNNGVFDSLNIIFGRPDYDKDKDTDPNASVYWGKICSQSTPIVDGEDVNPDIKFHMWASFSSLYEDTSHSEVDSHVFCHETGHTFGLEDYYDYGDNDYRPIGGATMMFHNTHQQDPFSTLTLGWSKVIIPETDCMIELEDYQSSRQSILLSPNPESVDSPFDEYILVELYAPNGVNQFDSTYNWQGHHYNKGPQEAGIRLWHVDARLAERIGETYTLTDNVMTTNPSVYAFSNTWGENHGSVMGSDYYDLSLLFEIRNDKDFTYRPTRDDENVMTSDVTLFHGGDVFTMEDYSTQFINGTKLDNGKDLGWKITVETIVTTEGGYKATINLEQL